MGFNSGFKGLTDASVLIYQNIRCHNEENLKYYEGGRCVGLTTLPPSCADSHEMWEPRPPGTLGVCSRPVQRYLYLYLHQVKVTQCDDMQ